MNNDVDRLNGISELSVGDSLERLGGNPAIYVKVLHIFEKKYSSIRERIVSCLDNEDFDNFTIEIHGLKGALANIGADKLSQRAKTLEFASKDSLYKQCVNDTPGLLSDVDALVEKITKI